MIVGNEVIGAHAFLFGLAFLWTIFAVVQDLKTREVANWLTFSLIAFALTYRAFYAVSVRDYRFFLLGLLGFFVFVLASYGLYYGRVFAGGDAKLLMGYGALLPYSQYGSLFFLSAGFLILLLTLGAVYSLAYSAFVIVPRHRVLFWRAFRERWNSYRSMLIASVGLFVFFVVVSFYSLLGVPFVFLTIVPLTYLYTKAVESCMIKRVGASRLREGDWLVHDVRVGSILIKKSVHGLRGEDIVVLRKADRAVVIKEGVPFVPAFLFALIVMVYVVVVLGASLDVFFLF